MTDSRTILANMARQMYEDIRFVTQLNPINIVDDDTAYAYNSLLAEARQAFANNGFLAPFKDMQPRNIKYKDAVVVCGQFASVMSMLTNRPSAAYTPITAGATSPAGGGAKPAPAGAEKPEDEVYHEQLYGPTPVPKRNNDGTIPFSLE